MFSITENSGRDLANHWLTGTWPDAGPTRRIGW